MNCVAAIGVVHFSVRGFGCALFYFRKEFENMKAKKFSAVATAVALLISLTACAGTGNEQASSADKSTSDIIDSATSSVDEHTSTESVEETSSENDNANDESTITESSETSVADATSSIPMKEEKIEERDVYDDDGNVVDKIKVKVVDGVTYTVGEKSGDKAILKNAPLISNGDKYPSGTSISCVTMLLQFNGEKVTQDDVAKMFTYYSESDWYYGEDGRYYGPEKSPYILLSDPKKKSETYYSDINLSEIGGVLRKYCDNHLNVKYSIIKYSRIVNNYELLQKMIKDNILLSISVRNSENNSLIKKWIAECENGTEMLMEISTKYFACMLIGYSGENIYVYDPFSSKILTYEFEPVQCINDVEGIERE